MHDWLLLPDHESLFVRGKAKKPFSGPRGCLHQSVQQVEGVCLALEHICNFSSGIASSGPLFTTPIRIY